MNIPNELNIYFNTNKNNTLVKLEAVDVLKNIKNTTTITKINQDSIDPSLDSLAQSMFVDIRNILVEINKFKLLPDLGKPLNININNINTTDRTLNYNNKEGSNLPYEAIPHTLETDIYLPLDVYDSIGKDQILTGNSYSAGNKNFLQGILYSDEETHINIQRSNLINILTHELGHYYFKILYPTSEIKEKINSKEINEENKNQLITWFKNLHEGFADAWSIGVNYQLNQANNLSILPTDKLISYLSNTRQKSSEPQYNLGLVYSIAKDTDWSNKKLTDTCIELAYTNSLEVLKLMLLDKDIHPTVLNTLNNFESKFNISSNENFLLKFTKPFWDKNNMLKRINSITSQEPNNSKYNENNNYGQLKIPKHL